MYARSNPTPDTFTASPEKYPQGSFRDKPCRTCGTIFSPIAPSHLHCSDKCSTRAQTSRYLNRTYGIDIDEYERMLKEQNHVCKICGGDGFLMKESHRVKLVVDHCHTTGEVRGLLCHNCNRAIGLLQDNVTTMRNAIAYLEGATTIPKGSTPKRVEAQDTER